MSDKSKKDQSAARSSLLPEELAYVRAATSAWERKPSVAYRIMSCSIIAFFIFLLVWAALAEVDEVARAEGQVVASQRIQAIQNLEGGILSELFVQEGQLVAQGDILARLDNEMAAASYRDAVNRALGHLTVIVRLQAELERKPPVFTNVLAWLAELTGAPLGAEVQAHAAQIFQDQTAAWQARALQQEAELSLLRSQYEQRVLEVEEQTARLRQVEGNLAITMEKIAMLRPLMKSGSYSRVEFMKLQSQEVALTGERDSLNAALPRAVTAANEAAQRMTFRSAELNTVITDEINKRRQELASIRENISAGGDSQPLDIFMARKRAAHTGPGGGTGGHFYGTHGACRPPSYIRPALQYRELSCAYRGQPHESGNRKSRSASQGVRHRSGASNRC
jgi:adhesin transport system membrane fusion protein